MKEFIERIRFGVILFSIKYKTISMSFKRERKAKKNKYIAIETKS